MKSESSIARIKMIVNASTEEVWHALITPAIVRKYMFGTTVVSDFKEGSDIRWSGEWEGKHYEDKGRIVSIENNRLLKYTHFSPLAGQPDIPENYHTVTISLTERNGMTEILLEQDNNKTPEEKSHSETNWKQMFQKLKDVVEHGLAND
jgi:uncharacterized protein YndB with AHSA1/START domain